MTNERTHVNAKMVFWNDETFLFYYSLNTLLTIVFICLLLATTMSTPESKYRHRENNTQYKNQVQIDKNLPSVVLILCGMDNYLKIVHLSSIMFVKARATIRQTCTIIDYL